VNFFKLYVGDYQRDTAHLSITEHGAYLLMLQHYYATEKPLPTGKALHRMLRAQDRAEREAIDAVAAQFWQETPDGLVNARADAEIARAAAQAETNRVIAVAREERRKTARRANDTSTIRGDDRAKSSTNRLTNDQPNQTPDTRHQKNPVAQPVSQEETGTPVPPPQRAAFPAKPPPLPPNPPVGGLDADTERRRTAIAVLLRTHSVAATAHHPTVVGWAQSGVTDEQLVEAVGLARLRKPAGPLATGYLEPIVAELRNPPPPADKPRRATTEWWTSDSATLAKAVEVGVVARAGEDWGSLRSRIREAVERRDREVRA
jgi:uncharacterized protein YdaU (DUF1376 family)